MKIGLIVSLIILVGAVAVAFWPVLLTARFWVSLGIIAGMVGTFVFAVALAERNNRRT